MTSDNQEPAPDQTIAIVRRKSRTADAPDLEWLFLCWSWEAGYRHWDDGVRALVRALRGLERIGFVTRARRRRSDGTVQHTFVLTDDGREGLEVLAALQENGGLR